jgi:ubiquinone/menaquinone biosynthesis C-methylase UbiE
VAEFSNPRALRGEQYKSEHNLNARIALHERFSVNQRSWRGWVFEHLELEGARRVLELGCGPGNLWAKNLERLPRGIKIVLSDFSPGMLRAARRKLAGQPQFEYACWETQQPAARPGSFDCAIANHMLYHLPDVPAGLEQIRRLLNPGGVLHASTNGEAHLREIWGWVHAALPERGDAVEAFKNIYSFSVENGAELLSEHFNAVEYFAWEDGLEITEAQPLVDFVASSSMMTRLDAEELGVFRDFLSAKLATDGVLRVTKNAGIFVARGPRN